MDAIVEPQRGDAACARLFDQHRAPDLEGELGIAAVPVDPRERRGGIVEHRCGIERDLARADGLRAAEQAIDAVGAAFVAFPRDDRFGDRPDLARRQPKPREHAAGEIANLVEREGDRLVHSHFLSVTGLLRRSMCISYT